MDETRIKCRCCRCQETAVQRREDDWRYPQVPEPPPIGCGTCSVIREEHGYASTPGWNHSFHVPGTQPVMRQECVSCGVPEPRHYTVDHWHPYRAPLGVGRDGRLV